MIRQAVLGCGRWGSFHLWYGNHVGNDVIGWEPGDSPPFRELVRTRRNEYLTLPDGVTFTTDLSMITGSDLVIVTAPAQQFRTLASLLEQVDLSTSDLCLCMKGLERDTGKRLTEIARDAGLQCRSISVWVGPGHPQQFVTGVPSCMLVATDDEEASMRIASWMGSDLIRFYRSRDLIGCEVGAAAKNVIGIAAGILDGLHLSGLKGALMARAPQEVARLVAAMGGDWRSVYGLSHLGDYEATLFSPLSNNRRFGELFATGRTESLEKLAEGVDTSRAMLLLAERFDVELPITETVRKIIIGELPARQALGELFSRPQKEEFPRTFHQTGG